MRGNFLAKLCKLIVITCVSILCGGLSWGLLEVRAQSAVEVAEDRAADLRIKLDDLKERQAELEDQLADLDEQMDPQNIENSLAGVGSTRPEDLRELRRRQLERQKIGVQNELNILAESQSRLENAIAEAEADAYYESAGLVPAAPQVPDDQTPDGSVTQSNDSEKKCNGSETTMKAQTRPRRIRSSVVKQASANNP
jgi:hypothetical protein